MQEHARVREEETAAAATEPADNGSSTRVFTARDPVPAEGDPVLRDGMTIEQIEPADGEQFPDHAGRRAPANITDICHDYKIGTSDCYIRVERVEPKVYQNIQTAGYIGEIRRAMSEGEFHELFGGAIFLVQVYGPDPRGAANKFSGEPVIKALTKPIKVTMGGRPHIVGQADIDDDPRGRSPDMRGWNPPYDREPQARRPGPPPSTADASMHRDSLQFSRDMITDKNRENERLRSTSSQPSPIGPVVEAVKDASNVATEALRDSHRSSEEMLRRQLESRDSELAALRGEIREARDKPTESAGAWSAMSTMAQALAPGQRSTEESTRIHESHRDEVRRVEDNHRTATEQLRSSFEERMRAKESEQERDRNRHAEDLRQVREETDRRERLAKEEGERRLATFEERSKANIDQLKESHDRELKARERQEELLRETNKIGNETKIAAAEERARIANEETERARTEANEKTDFMGQMEEFGHKAEILGFKKDNEDQNPPKGWAERLAHAAGNALENAGDIFEKASETFDKRNQAMQTQMAMTRQAQAGARPPLPQGQRQSTIRGAGGKPVGVQRTVWQTSDGPPIQRTPAPAPKDKADAPPPAEPQHRPNEPPIPAAAPPPPDQPQAQPPAAAPEEPAPPEQPPEQPPAQAQPSMAFNPQAIEQMRLALEHEYTQGRSAEEFAQMLYAQFGQAQLQQLVAMLSPEQVLEAMSEDAATAESPLLTRPGQQWFRKVWEGATALAQQVAQTN